MTTKAVILAQKSGEGTDMILPHTSADLVGYEKENSTATNVRRLWTRSTTIFRAKSRALWRGWRLWKTRPIPRRRR